MKFDLSINGIAEQIEVLASPPECAFRLGTGDERQAAVESPEPGVYSVLLDGRSYEARIEEQPNALVVVIDGFRFEIEVRDPRRMARRGGAPGREGVETIAAAMPGKVVRVLVQPGDRVEAGQGLLVVEAMKMQNEMRASRPGRVATLAAWEGLTVTAGEVLATIE